MRGYTYKATDEIRTSEAVWGSPLRDVGKATTLTFMDLMEVRFIDAFRQHGVGWKTIRIAAQHASELFDRTYPFSTKQFKTDGRTIFAEVGAQTKNQQLIDLARNQYAFHQVLSRDLYLGLEFAERDEVRRWWPLGTRRRVVVDPQRAFGQPIVNREGVPTAVLSAAYKTEKSISRVASWYEVEPLAVRDALAFEEKIAA